MGTLSVPGRRRYVDYQDVMRYRIMDIVLVSTGEPENPARHGRLVSCDTRLTPGRRSARVADCLLELHRRPNYRHAHRRFRALPHQRSRVVHRGVRRNDPIRCRRGAGGPDPVARGFDCGLWLHRWPADGILVQFQAGGCDGQCPRLLIRDSWPIRGAAGDRTRNGGRGSRDSRQRRARLGKTRVPDLLTTGDVRELES